MPYLPTTPSYKPPHLPPPNSVPIQIHLLPTSCIHTFFILAVTTPVILIAIKGLPSYQQDIPCQLLVQLLHHVALTQLQHFRVCPDDLPTSFGLPLHTTLSLLPGPILDLLVFHFFHHYLEELPTNVLHPTFAEIFLSLTKLSNTVTWNKSDLSPPLSPCPWPFTSHPHPLLLPIAQ